MDEGKMTKEQSKQTIEEFRNKTSECKMTKFEALCKVLDNFVSEQGAELDKERLEDFIVGVDLGRGITKCVFLKCPENDGCKKCKYKNFWTKEVGY